MNLSTGCLLARRTGVTLHATCHKLNFWRLSGGAGRNALTANSPSQIFSLPACRSSLPALRKRSLQYAAKPSVRRLNWSPDDPLSHPDKTDMQGDILVREQLPF
jgi:hypothetical protein